MKSASRILVADDDPINLAIIEEILGTEYDLTSVSSGDAAVEVAAKVKPDLVLTDIMMPGMNGYEVCRRLRASPDQRNVKIVLVSAKAMVSERLKGYEAGADDYITKPFEEAELSAKVKVFLRLKSVEEVDRLKTDVLTLLSHEVRTPLNGILPLAEMLLSGEPLEESDRQSFVRTIAESSRALCRLFSRVLLLCNLRTGGTVIRSETLDLQALIEQTASLAQASRPGRSIVVSVERGPPLPAKGDPGLLQTALGELLDNAIRFSPEGGRVRVGAQLEGRIATVSVSDSGCGIDPRVLPQVFEGFVSGETRKHSEGHGLGLALAHAILLQHHGDVNARPNPEGGTIFTLVLPAEAAAKKL